VVKITRHYPDVDDATIYPVLAIDDKNASIETRDGSVIDVFFPDRDHHTVVTSSDQDVPIILTRCSGGIAAAEQPRELGWQPIEENADCAVWNDNPQPNETVSWTGLCVDGIAAGDGILTWHFLWDGEWKESTYSGRVVNGRYHGFGVQLTSGGVRYEGDWRENLKHGYGVSVSPSGDSYDGNYRNGVEHGYGRQVSVEREDLYEGEFQNGERHGQGRAESADGGGSYEGEWYEGRVHGQGVWSYSNGIIYEGAFVDDERHGYGKAVNSDGDGYEGEWANGRRHGRGVQFFADGATFDGTFSNGQMYGRGVAKYSNGSVYKGEFLRFSKHGRGVIKFSSGVECDGEWSEDELVDEGEAWNGEYSATCYQDGDGIHYY